MKPPARRLGRGLGAFLDFGPAGEDGTAFVEGALEARGASVLETSAEAPPAPPAFRPAAPVPAAPAAPRPAVAEPAPVPAAPSPPGDGAFVDEVVEGLSFPEVELE